MISVRSVSDVLLQICNLNRVRERERHGKGSRESGTSEENNRLYFVFILSFVSFQIARSDLNTTTPRPTHFIPVLPSL